MSPLYARSMIFIPMVSGWICVLDVSILTSPVTEWVRGGRPQIDLLMPTETILEARDMIMRVGKENCAADSSMNTIIRTGRDWCHAVVWHTAIARPVEPCPNGGCGGSHLLADCQYKTMCAGCGAIGHLHKTCTVRCFLCAKHHSARRCPRRRGGVWPLIPQMKNQGSQQAR